MVFLHDVAGERAGLFYQRQPKLIVNFVGVGFRDVQDFMLELRDKAIYKTFYRCGIHSISPNYSIIVMTDEIKSTFLLFIV